VSRPSVDLGSETYDALGPIAYLTGEYPRATDTFIQREIAALRSFGVDVRTFSVRRTDTAHHVGPEQRAEAVQTFYVQPASLRPHVLLKAHAWAFLRSPLRYLKSIILAVRSGAPGVRGLVYQVFYFAEAGVLADELQGAGIGHLHNHFGNSSCSVAMLASALADVPYSYTLHGPSELFDPMHWRMDLKIARAEFVACISYFARSQAMLFSDPAHWPKLRVVHCGVVPERYQQPARESGEGVRLLFVGRLARIKGLRILFEAFARARVDHPNLSLTLIGDGPERAHAEAEAARIGGISLMGSQSQDAVAAAFGDADALVLPSFAEGVPVVLMEAMAAGLPVIATRVGGVGELVQDGVSGLLVAPGDTDALQDAILDLVREPARRRAMGAAGAAIVAEEFDCRVEAARLFSLFRGTGGTAPRPEPARPRPSPVGSRGRRRPRPARATAPVPPPRPPRARTRGR